MLYADIDAVTVDGYGTLLTLRDPLPALQAALAAHGVQRSRHEVRAGFAAEVAHYKPRSLRGCDAAGLAALRLECVAVFLTAAGAGDQIEAAGFVDAFVDSLSFEAVPGAVATLDDLRRRGIALAMISNWDCALPQHIDRLGLGHLFQTVVASAVVGAEKPDPRIFQVALAQLGVEPGRALHIGDEPSDEQGAAAAGMRFAPAPIAAAFEGWS